MLKNTGWQANSIELRAAFDCRDRCSFTATHRPPGEDEQLYRQVVSVGKWSHQFEDRYQARLPGDVRAWLDDELWREPIGAEFCQPLRPEQLLAPTHDEIWAGFMRPDTLPLIGNDYGDWLCLRFGVDNTVREVVRWSHAGGDWAPYGDTLSEALVFDAALRVCRARRPEFVDPELPTSQLYGAAEWAVQQGTLAMERFWPEPFGSEHSGAKDSDGDDASTSDNSAERRLFRQLLDAGVAVVPAACELALLCLDNPLRSRGAPAVARQFETPWLPDFVRWMFDSSHLDEADRRRIGERWDMPVDALVQQDWEAAEQYAMEVLEVRGDLAWAADIAGWSAERRGDWATAADRYRRGLRASTFTDDSIRFRTQWYPESFGKFSAYRLQSLASHVAFPADEYLTTLWQRDEESLRARVADHWLQEAASCARRADHVGEYECLLQAGWDLGLPDLQSYPDLLRDLERAAASAGATALARIAQTHANAF
ncbi:MAG: SMI1/KNR4 family protein [Planctomycetales bacterium]|nr:SMI1/KNR4 family protein [Planctomycetales bacterium]